jgi:mannose-6-phosphate isomerase
MDGPVRFKPLLMERVWGGRRLADLGKSLPADRPIGESWELVDRPDTDSVVDGGELDGRTLGSLWRERRDLFGARAAGLGPRFPLLIKLLDAREALSVQVHPPPAIAAALGGESKTESWFVAAADPGAHLLVGLRRGVTRAGMEAALRDGEDVAALLQRVDVAAGDAILIPSGRVHAIGPGIVIVEIQQSSDTTYRVFDYGRPGLDGRPRDLHVEKSLQSIDFDDFEPRLADTQILACDYFEIARWRFSEPRPATPPGEMAVLCVVGGRARCGAAELVPGDVVLVPAVAGGLLVEPDGAVELLQVTFPPN